MATSAQTIAGDGLSIGRMFQRALSTIRHNPLLTIMLAFLFGALPGMLTGIPQSWLTDDLAGSGDAVFWGIFALFYFLGGIIASLTLAFQTRATIAKTEGRRATFAECGKAGSAVLLPALGVGVIASLAITVGLFMLIAPGLIMLTLWSVAIPALVEEKKGVLASLTRSLHLTRGARAKIFGLMLVLFTASFFVSVVIEIVTGEWGSRAMMTAYTNPTYLLLSAVSGTLLTAIYGAVQASLYVELRDWKDGPATHNLEQIFA